MHDDADFLRAILADPFDDEPRLIYADWLEDRAHESGGGERCEACNGMGWAYDDTGGNIGVQKHCHVCHSTGRIPDPRVKRAEFIRVQCAISEMCHWHRQGNSTHPGFDALIDSERELDNFVMPSRQKWLWSLGIDYSYCVFSSGFMKTLSCTLAAFEQHAAEIFSRHPVTDVRLTGRKPLWLSQADHYAFSHGNDLLASSCNIPKTIWDELIDNDRLPILPPNWKSYPTADAARLALSRACVDYGRSRVGLPPLTWPAMPANELSGISG